MRVKELTLLGLLATTLSISAPLQAGKGEGVYQWTDEKGHVHFSDKPPKGQESDFIKTQTGSRQKTSEAVAEAEAEQQANNTKPEAMEVLPEKNPEVCKQAKANLEALSGRPRVRITEADGSQRFLTDEEKEAQREIARKNAEMHCN
jgi:hypothetical protein